MRHKNNWPDGPWTNESDRDTFEAHGLKCLVLRTPVTGALCGYVGVPDGHSLHGANCDTATTAHLDAHGGLTFAGTFEDEDPAMWWLGFDCSHFGDLCPALRLAMRGEYRDLAFVRAETERLAAQIGGM